jgi:hypothetical protein
MKVMHKNVEQSGSVLIWGILAFAYWSRKAVRIARTSKIWKGSDDPTITLVHLEIIFHVFKLATRSMVSFICFSMREREHPSHWTGHVWMFLPVNLKSKNDWIVNIINAQGCITFWHKTKNWYMPALTQCYKSLKMGTFFYTHATQQLILIIE